MATRWFFTNSQTRKTYTVEYPGAAKGFKGWTLGTPMVEVDGTILYGREMAATQDEKVVCARNCEYATEPGCVCSCGGRNHGKAWSLPEIELTEDDKVWLGVREEGTDD